MNKIFFDNLESKLSYELYDSILPFWRKNGPDREHGGCLHSFDMKGKLVDSNKGVWIQGRFTWLLSWLALSCSDKKERESLLQDAKLGAEFLMDHCIDSSGRCYFIVTRDGSPVRQRRYLFGEVFAAMGLHTYGTASGDRRAIDKGEELLNTIRHHLTHPEALPSKTLPSAPRMRSHSMTMILINLYQQFRANTVSPEAKKEYSELINRQIEEFFYYFYKEEYKTVLEYTAEDGSLLDSPEGREVNPGHAIETAWFILEESRVSGNEDHQKKALKIIDWALESGWDKEYGGLLSFIDRKGYPSMHVEWDMKYWWPHTEALYALLLAYDVTKRRQVYGLA